MKVDLNIIAGSLDRFGQWLNRLPMAFFVLIVFAVALLKATFIWTPWIFEASEQFPEPALQRGNQFTGIALARLVNENSWFYFIVTAVAITAAIVYVWRAGDGNSITSGVSRTRLILAVSWPLVLSGLAWYGYGTELMPLFAAFSVLARRRWLWLVGIFGTSLTHPELSLVSFVGLVLLASSREFRSLLARGLIGAVVSLIVVVFSSLWLSSAGAETRGQLAIDFLPGALRSQLRHSVMGLYSAWSVWWVLILIAFLLVGQRAKQLLLISAVVLPSVVTMVTLDATRVFTGSAAAVGLASYWLVTSRLTPSERSGSNEANENQNLGVLGLVFIAFLLLPNVQFKTVLDPVPEPGRLWVDMLEVYVLPALHSIGM